MRMLKISVERAGASKAWRTSALVGAGVASVLTLASCSSSQPSKSASGSHKVIPTATTTIPEITSSTVEINGRTVAVPTEGGSTPIDQAVATGQQIVLHSHGVLPAQLFASGSSPVVWTNLTSQTITLTINNVGLSSQKIAPGASYSWRPNVLDFSFSASNGGKGVVNVDAFTP